MVQGIQCMTYYKLSPCRGSATLAFNIKETLTMKTHEQNEQEKHKEIDAAVEAASWRGFLMGFLGDEYDANLPLEVLEQRAIDKRSRLTNRFK